MKKTIINSNYGTATIDGKTYDLIEMPLMGNHLDGVAYFAGGTDENGEEVVVMWETTEEWNRAEELLKDYDPARDERTDEQEVAWVLLQDEANACDWDNPASVRRV